MKGQSDSKISQLNTPYARQVSNQKHIIGMCISAVVSGLLPFFGYILNLWNSDISE